MRIIYWILGAAAAAGTVYVLGRGKRQGVPLDFLEALRQGPVTIDAYEPQIVPPGWRAEVFRGEAAGRPFAFVAQADSSGTRWVFALVWGAGQFQGSWNSSSGESEHPLQAAYQILRRHSSKPDGDRLN